MRYFEKFGATEKMIRDALAVALRHGSDYADLFFQHRVSSLMLLEDGAVSSASANVELGVGVRVVSGDQTGYGFTEDLTDRAIQRAAAMAAAIADGPASPTPHAFHALSNPPQRYVLERSWEDVRPDESVTLVKALHERAHAADTRIKKVSASISAEHGAVLIADSRGRMTEDVQPMTTLALTCTAEENGRRETYGYKLSARRGIDTYSDERLDHVAREAVGRTVILLEAFDAPTGEMPVVLAAGSSGVLLHEAIGHGMEADFNRKNISIYSDRIGKPIAKPFVHIVDDGALPFSRGAINVDDEGNVAGTTHLVEGGVLATYLHDSISARHYDVAPTGNGRRQSYRFPPMPRMRTTYMLPGPHDRDEIIASVKKGIYCATFSNGEVKIGAGDFAFYMKNGFLIEDGKLTRPIKDVNLIGSGPKVLEQLDMVANDLLIDESGGTCGKNGQFVPVSLGMPTVRVPSITVGGR